MKILSAKEVIEIQQMIEKLRKENVELHRQLHEEKQAHSRNFRLAFDECLNLNMEIKHLKKRLGVE